MHINCKSVSKLSVMLRWDFYIYVWSDATSHLWTEKNHGSGHSESTSTDATNYTVHFVDNDVRLIAIIYLLTTSLSL